MADQTVKQLLVSNTITTATVTGAEGLYLTQNPTTSAVDGAIILSTIKAYSLATATLTGHPTIEGVTSTGATGTGSIVFATSPTLITPALGIPASGTLTNCTGLPAAGVVGTAAILGSNTGSLTVSGALQAGTTIGISTDALLVRDAANVLAMQNGANAQELRVYNTFTNSSNYARGVAGFATTSTSFLVGTQKAGTGGNLDVDISPTGFLYLRMAVGQGIRFYEGVVLLWRMFNTSGSFIPESDITSDIGGAANRVRDLYVGRDYFTAGGTQAIIRSQTTLTSGAGASVGTLTNAPAAGNPTSWIKINDNGTTRYIPAW